MRKNASPEELRNAFDLARGHFGKEEFFWAGSMMARHASTATCKGGIGGRALTDSLHHFFEGLQSGNVLEVCTDGAVVKTWGPDDGEITPGQKQ